MSHDYKRQGATTLFAALNTLDGSIISRGEQRHRHEEWLKFLRQIDRETLKDRSVHLICDNLSIPGSKNGWEWLTKYPRFTVHFSPTLASWLNMVERFFRDLTTERLRRGVFHSVPELKRATQQYIAVHNQQPKPFVLTTKANDLLASGDHHQISPCETKCLHVQEIIVQ